MLVAAGFFSVIPSIEIRFDDWERTLERGWRERSSPFIAPGHVFDARFVARSSTNYVRTRGFFLSVETLTEHNTVTIMYRECAATIVSSNHKAIGWPWKSRHVTRKRKTTNRRSTNAPLTLSCLTLHNWLWLSPMGKDMAQPCVSQYKWSYLIKIPGLLGTCSYFAVPVCTLSNWKQVDDASFSYLFVL